MGQGGAFRRYIQEAVQVRIVDRGAKVVVIGEEGAASLAEEVLKRLLKQVRRGEAPVQSDVEHALAGCSGEAGGGQESSGKASRILRKDIHVRPRTEGQEAYLSAIEAYEMVLVSGPAGTGKTYLAMAAAVSALLSKRVQRLILTRPAVEAGENLGFLPGDLEQKVNPYLRPLYDALYSMVDMERVRRFIEQERIEVAPLGFMRGRTLDNAFIILDEAQNTTADQMLMFLTRLGQGSRAVITGDVTQVDLPRGTVSGLVEACARLGGTEGIGIVQLSKRDVVRNPLVQRIINAYEEGPVALGKQAEGGGDAATC